VGYFEQLAKAADWLASIQNKDHGWGLAGGYDSSVVNTAEAVYVLTQASTHQKAVHAGLEYIQSRLFASIEKQGPRTRYAFFALFGMADHLDKVDPAFVAKCTEWLIQARNKDGGWGHSANDEQSRLFPTSMTLLQLARCNYTTHDLKTGYNWLTDAATESGWSFEVGKSPTPAATAQAVLALRSNREHTDNIFTRPKELLLQTTHWSTERENLPGSLWAHGTYMSVLPALVSLDVNPYDPVIAQGVRTINDLTFDGGWREPSGSESVRGQFWAVFAFAALQKAFDPAIHIYRIDSATAQAVLTEPAFVNIKVRGPWAIIIPRFIYQFFAYLLLLMSFAIFFGINRLVPAPSRGADLFISLACFGLAYYTVRKRRDLFHARIFWVFTAIVLVSTVVDQVFGISVKNLFEYATQYLPKG
jgi:hypothetical protein